VRDAKQALRRAAAERRKAMSDDAREHARAAIGAAIQVRVALALRPGSRIALYEPLRTEPLPRGMATVLAAGGFDVIVPVTLTDNDLDWRHVESSSTLGTSAITGAGLVLVPAFSVDLSGNRLGRGGGSYDRALARTGPAALIAAVLYEFELVEHVPVDRWDRPVSAVVRPSGWLELG
jgi:5-formyltetrahydrofolate cyclo-ligase